MKWWSIRSIDGTYPEYTLAAARGLIYALFKKEFPCQQASHPVVMSSLPRHLKKFPSLQGS